jgi:hypothetical protein
MINSKLETLNSKQILHHGFVTPAYRQAGANDENCDSLLSPPPLMGEGEGGGGHSVFVPPHLNPLPPGERRYFPGNPNVQSIKLKTVIF